jgi:hypothetical protein
MKKELLLASALVGTVGLAGVAEAASATMSGKTRVGVSWADTDAAGDATMAGHQQSSFSVAISETTDGGTGIATGFDLTDENDGATDNSGLTLTFTSGAKLDLIEAGSAYASHLASVPGASGEQGISGSTGMNAPSGLDYADSNDSVGFELHTAADAFGVDGLKAGVSMSFNGDAASTTSAHALENAFSLGASYVSTAGDSTVTIGAGYASGDNLVGNTTEVDQVLKSVSVMTAGAKYVSGDMTFNVGYVNGEGADGTLGSTSDGAQDSYEETNASVDYTVASGVTATLGYTDIARGSEGTNDSSHGGTAWYIGANVSF